MQEKKSVGIVTPVFPPYRGGIGRVAEMDALQLAALGYDVTVYVPARAKRGGTRIETRPDAAYRVVEVAPFFRYGNAALVPQVASALARHDVVLLHYPFFGGAEPLALRTLLPHRAKLVVMYHMDVVGKGALAPFFSAHSRLIAPFVLGRADVLCATSKDYASHSPLLSRFGDAVRELAPSVDTKTFAPGPKDTALMARYGFAADDVVAVFVGGLDAAHYFKGIPVLLDALVRVANPKLKALIVGDGDLRVSYEARARDLGIANRVVFAGAVSDILLADHYRLGDFFVFPSIDKSEAFGVAALESLACGVPAIASALPGVRTVVRPGETGLLVRPGDVDALADAMERLASDPQQRARLATAARAHALRYSPEERMKVLDGIMKILVAA